MSIFRPFKYKPRPDLLSDAPVKHGFFVFWEIMARKFWRFVTINIFYFIITLPMLIYFYTVCNLLYYALLESRGLLESMQQASQVVDIFPGVAFFSVIATYIPQFLHIPLLALSVFLYGPATMGMAYIFRNFAREEHAWISDFFSRGWANFKQGLFFGILDVVMVLLLTSGMIGGVQGGSGVIPILSVIVRTLSGIGLVVYLFMRHYFYIMAVTVDLSVFKIIKNALLFVVIGFGRNILSELVSLLAFVVCFLTVPIFSLITLPFIFYSFTGFTTIYICYPVVKKYIVVPSLERERKEKQEGEGV
jgi:uncharacterized membrane protein YesL